MISPLNKSEKKRIAPLYFVYFTLPRAFFQGIKTLDSCTFNKFMELHEKEKAILCDFGNMHKFFEGPASARSRSHRAGQRKKALFFAAKT